MLEIFDWYARRMPAPLLLPLSLPLGRQMKTEQFFLYENARMIETAFGFIHNNEIKGDYVEFGVFRGRTFVEACNAARRYGTKEMRFFAFDSFAGLPEISEKDAGGAFKTGQFSAARNVFEQALRRNRVDRSRVHVVEGFYDETLKAERRKELGIERVAIAWIDCDLYASTVPVLNFLSEVLVDGALLIFDDWYCFNGHADRGEQRACAEWLAANPQIKLVEYQNFHWAGRSFIVNRLDSLDSERAAS
ncbi:MAG: methyltransferase [Acidobacteria bacterium]|nr:MAG: methyltransferase [Acidobacteriota bacterium]